MTHTQTQNTSASPMVRQEIKDWQLDSQGEQGTLNWTLSASLARQDAGGWRLTGLSWQSPSSGLRLNSPEARQLKPKVYELPSVTASGWQSTLRASHAELNLAQNKLSGQALRLEGKTWSLEAKSFSAPLPLRKWSLQQVHGRFLR